MTFEILYPEQRRVTKEWIISQAKDELATAYMQANPYAESAAIEENSRVSSLLEAIDILDDAGVVTFTRDAREQAEWSEA